MLNRFTIILVTIATLFIAASSHARGGNTTVRPIEDFLEQQGTLDIGFLLVPPLPNFLGASGCPPKQETCPENEDGSDLLLASIDYAGLVDDFYQNAFRTRATGVVLDKRLRNGQRLITVHLITSRALTWAATNLAGAFDFANETVLFGNRFTSVPNQGENPALGTALIKTNFILDEEAPLPDLISFYFNPGIQSFELVARARGECREAFGVEDGAPGKLTVIQSAKCPDGRECTIPDLVFDKEIVDLRCKEFAR